MKHIIVILLTILPLLAPTHNIRAYADWNYICKLIQPYNRSSKARIASCILWSAYDNGLDPKLVARVAKRESDFRWWVISPYGARGIMQVTRHWDHVLYTLGDARLTAKLLATSNHTRYWLRIGYNIEGGCRVLKHYTSKYGLALGLLAYNIGDGGKNKAFQAARRRPELALRYDYVQEVIGE